MRRFLIFAVAGLFASLVQAQDADPVLMTVNGVDVPRSEFEYSFNKNNGEGVIDKKSAEEYAELYANYKLKVQAALDARLDTMQSFQDEFELYRDQLVRPTFVTDQDVELEAFRAWQRAKERVGERGLIRPAHIFLRLSTKATDSQQQQLKERADSIWQALKNGADFEALAKQYSQDYRTAQQGGQMPWIGPKQTYPEFEQAAYALQTGQFSQPVLAPDGYHIILMKERKQLEPFEEVKSDIIRQFEQQGIREAIAQQRVKQTVEERQITEKAYMQQRADSLAAADTEMKYLILEYHDGLLLYEISSREVWQKAEKDEGALNAWFLAHRSDYTWEEPHYKGIAYRTKEKADVKAVKRCVKSLPFGQWADVLRQTFNPDSVIRIRVEKGLFKPGDNALVDQLGFKITPKKEFKPMADYPYTAVYGKKLKRPEDYTDVRSEVVTDVQNQLEQEWVAQLRRRYPVKINQTVLNTVNKH